MFLVLVPFKGFFILNLESCKLVSIQVPNSKSEDELKVEIVCEHKLKLAQVIHG